VTKTLDALTFALLALGAAFLVAPSQAAGPAICDVQQSPLCRSLNSVYSFEENSDSPRWDENKGIAWLEAEGQDIDRASGKIDTYAASFSGMDGNYLYIPRAGALMNSQTISMWIYPTSNIGEQIILSGDEVGKPAPYFSVVPNGSYVRARLTIPYGDNRGSTTVDNNTDLSLNTWYLVTFGFEAAASTDFTTTNLTGLVAYVRVNDGTRVEGALAYFTLGYANDLILGQGLGVHHLPFSGRVDQLTFADRPWKDADVNAFYNSGSGTSFPFGGTVR